VSAEPNSTILQLAAECLKRTAARKYHVERLKSLPSHLGGLRSVRSLKRLKGRIQKKKQELKDLESQACKSTKP
jgi:hypothetical protein